MFIKFDILIMPLETSVYLGIASLGSNFVLISCSLLATFSKIFATLLKKYFIFYIFLDDRASFMPNSGSSFTKSPESFQSSAPFLSVLITFLCASS